MPVPHGECAGRSSLTQCACRLGAARRLDVFQHSTARSGFHRKRNAYREIPRRHCCQAAAATDQQLGLKELLQNALEAPTSLKRLAQPPKPELATDKLPDPTTPTEGYLGQVGPTADAVREQAAPTAKAVKQQAAPAAEAVQSQAQQIAPDAPAPPGAPSDSLAGSAQAAGQQMQEQLSSVTNALPGSGQELQERVSSATKAVPGSVRQEVQDQVYESARQLTDALPTPDQALKISAGEDLEQLRNAASSSVQAVQDASGQLVDGVNQGLNQGLNQLLPGLQESFESTTAGITTQASQAASQAASSLMEALPGPAAEALQSAYNSLQPGTEQLWQYLTSEPKAGSAAAGLLVGVPLLASWRARFAGYSGQLPPQEAAKLLKRRNYLLVDIRSDAARDKNGIPVLRRGSRGKGAAVPVPRLRPGLAARLNKAQAFPLQIAALEIAGLSKAKRGTKIVIMDRNGGADAISVARNLQDLSRRQAYIIAGGFQGWVSSGLEVESGSSTYNATVLDSLTDEAEVVAEATTSFLRDPIVAIAAAGGVGLGGLALLDWHYALQYAGTLGILVSTVQWFTSYDSPQDAFADVKATFQKVSSRVGSLRGARQQAAGLGADAEAESFTEIDTDDFKQDSGPASQPTGSAAGRVQDSVQNNKVTS